MIATEVALLREHKLPGYIRHRGPWFFLLVFTFYLVRDTTLYIIIPYLVVNGLISCPGTAQ